MKTTHNILSAISFAAVAHKNQMRLDKKTPYVAHPFSVAMILYSYGYSEHVVIAGLLHDVVEDTTYTIDDISDAFGERVAMIVAAVTEDKGVSSRAGRKKLYLDNLANADNDTKAVCAADMLHNRLQVLDEIASGFKIWEHRDIGVDLYLQESYDKLRVIQETLNDELVLELESVLGQIRKS